MKLDTNIARYRYDPQIQIQLEIEIHQPEIMQITETAYAKCLTLNWPIRQADCLALTYR